MMSFEVTTGLEDFVHVCAFHLSLTHVSSCYSGMFTAIIPNLNYSYLANMIFHADIFHLTRGFFLSHQVITFITVFKSGFHFINTSPEFLLENYIMLFVVNFSVFVLGCS